MPAVSPEDKRIAQETANKAAINRVKSAEAMGRHEARMKAAAAEKSAPSPAPVSKPKPSKSELQGTVKGNYTVQKGDTLSALAKRQGTTVAALKAANPHIKDPNRVYAGAKMNLLNYGGVNAPAAKPGAVKARIASNRQDVGSPGGAGSTKTAAKSGAGLMGSAKAATSSGSSSKSGGVKPVGKGAGPASAKPAPRASSPAPRKVPTVRDQPSTKLRPVGSYKRDKDKEKGTQKN